MKAYLYTVGLIAAFAFGGLINGALSQTAPEKIQGKAVVPITAGENIYHTCKKPDGNTFIPSSRPVSAFPTIIAIWC